ncbi:hypothetical protein L1A45_01045 [Acinetobacter variabilis]|uniref:hypothetical protein n=1 Tax=Acinetobacter variabilis TaxID=70346 RepID=UPI0037701E04
MNTFSSFYANQPASNIQETTNKLLDNKHFFDIQKRNNENQISKNATESVKKILLTLK